MLHTMYFADEVRDFGEVDKGESAKIRDGELDLALRLIDELSHEEFKPEQYQDDYRHRVLELVELEGRGQGGHRGGPAGAARPGHRPHGRPQAEPRQAGGRGRPGGRAAETKKPAAKAPAKSRSAAPAAEKKASSAKK